MGIIFIHKHARARTSRYAHARKERHTHKKRNALHAGATEHIYTHTHTHKRTHKFSDAGLDVGGLIPHRHLGHARQIN